MYEHPQFFFLFCLFVCFSFAVLKFHGGDQAWLGAESQLSEHSHHVPFLFHLCCFWATAWHRRLGSFHPLQESQSCRSRRLAGGGGRSASLQASPPSRTNVPRPQNKGVLCQEQVSPSARSQLGHLMTQKGGLFQAGFGIQFCFFFKHRDTTLIKNTNLIPCKVLCQATLKNLLPSISSNSIFFNKVPKYTFTQIIVVPKNPLQLAFFYIQVYIQVYIYNVRFLQIG